MKEGKACRCGRESAGWIWDLQLTDAGRSRWYVYIPYSLTSACDGAYTQPTLFHHFRIESNSDNEIWLELQLDPLLKVLKSADSSGDLGLSNPIKVAEQIADLQLRQPWTHEAAPAEAPAYQIAKSPSSSTSAKETVYPSGRSRYVERSAAGLSMKHDTLS